MKFEVRVGIPHSMVSSESDVEEIKQNIIDGYLNRLNISKDDIEVTIEKTNGEFYTRISGEEDCGKVPMDPKSTKEITINEEEPINLSSVLDGDSQGTKFDNSDITKEQEEVCVKDDCLIMNDSSTPSKEELGTDEKLCVDDNTMDDTPWSGCNGYGGNDCIENLSGSWPRELSRYESNIALLKLYIILSDNVRLLEGCTEFGSIYLDCDEKNFLLHKLFEETGLDSIAKEVEKTLQK